MNYGFEPQQIVCACTGYSGEIHEYGADRCRPYFAKPQRPPTEPPFEPVACERCDIRPATTAIRFAGDAHTYLWCARNCPGPAATHA